MSDNQDSQFVIFVLHGIGGSVLLGRINYVRQLSKLLPYRIKFVLLQGKIIRLCLSKFYRLSFVLTGWYDIDDHSGLISSEDDHGLFTTINQIDELIAEEINQGIPARNIFLLGFSQGGSVVLSMAMISHHQLGGIIAISGFLPFYKTLKKNEVGVNKSVPILMIHGEEDSVVLRENGQDSVKILASNGYRVEFFTFPQTGHTDILLQSEEKVTEFLSQTFIARGVQPVEVDHKPEIKSIRIDKNSPWSTILGSTISIPSFFYSLSKKKKKNKTLFR